MIAEQVGNYLDHGFFLASASDGNNIIFRSSRDGGFNLYEKPASAAKDEEVVLKSPEEKYPASWSQDGRFLLYVVPDPKTKLDIQ